MEIFVRNKIRSLTIYVQSTKSGQTQSNNLSAVAKELFKCV